jgi:hypothetical protein
VTESSETFEFDVAVSFAGEDREYVESVVAPLKVAGVRVFYDADFMAETWGEDLIEYFDNIYRKTSRYAVIFISRHYAEKMWTRHERRSALARGLTERAAYVLPVRLDDSELDGLRPTVGYIDARHVGVDGIVSAVQKKLSGSSPVSTTAVTRVPRTEVEQQQVLLARPPGWEYLYFAGELLRGQLGLEDKYRDHSLRYASRSGQAVRREELADYISRGMGDIQRITKSLEQLLNRSVQDRAFGAPGEAGDPDRIRHLADRLTSSYSDSLDWAEKIRAASVTSNYHDLLDYFARFADDIIEKYRKLVADFVRTADRIPAGLAAGETLHFELVMTLELPDRVTEPFHKEMKRLNKAGLYP